ncbi:hypothetical protein [Methylobacter sp. S3L5C]|uniref:hypothetical protein n=1 Tax=Methylobacter sp. S3L5C TaxID=2839024 RepID=UPI001FAC0871|nr:hypothetical protein [Methylobacter sp. S3L5C]UOA08687.1 hypothetical protein KKZ03_21280 [Methylobacter sp. S3L5C]
MNHLKLNKSDYYVIVPFATVLILTIILMVLIQLNYFDAHKIQSKDQIISVVATSPRSPDSSIQIGSYIDNIYNLSIDNKTFDANGWVWVTWSEKAEEFFQSRKLTPDKWLNFANQIDNWDFKLEQFHDDPIKLKNGHYRQGFKFSGHFYINDISFYKFPFETLKIPVIFELTDLNEIKTDKSIHDLYLEPDQLASGIGNYIDLTGYNTIAFNVFSKTHVYGSSFGSTIMETKPISTSQVIFQTTYKQSVNSGLLSQFLPLTIVMLLVLLSPTLSSSLWDVRLGVPPTALLTLIFLQQGYREKLPDIAYITFIDSVYNCCYFAILITFILFLWGSNKINLAPESEKALLIDKIDLIDKRFQLFIPTIMIAIIVLTWIKINYFHP